ncbi:MAG TPA: transposase, partial [Nitrospiraceae bacterium]|nr:transposase [Nitrospiraceae bacterium]
MVQDIAISCHNIRYRLECWRTPEGTYIVGKLPEEVDSHFGSTPISYILYQYYHAHVTQPLILEQLQEFGIDISAGQINRIITERKNRFHAEKEGILKVGLAVSGHIHVDDTGARHEGQNGYCTHIRNEWFAWFQRTESKSRMNFLALLRAGHTDYVINADALDYMEAQRLPGVPLSQFTALCDTTYESFQTWEENIQTLSITDERHIRITTEGALLGSVLDHGFNKRLVIASDDAGQFDVLLHALCWIHAERIIHRLVGFSDRQKETLEEIRGRIWELYADMKEYKKFPAEEKKVLIEEKFDELCKSNTCFMSLNIALTRLHKNKSKLSRVLDRPDIPLHNNLSENDIREYVKKRKISGSTRS